MNRSQYDDLAKKINPRNPLNQQRDQKETPNEYWKENVKSKEDAEAFFKLFYPALPDVVTKALAYHIEACVDGKKELDPNWLLTNDRQKVAEEIQQLIEEQRMIGIENLKKQSLQ